MHTAKKPKVEGAESVHPAENSSDDDDDDDLFISVWDGKSTKKTSSNETSTKPKSKPLPNTTSTASVSGKSKQNASGRDRNGLVTTLNNPSHSRVSPRKLQNQNSRTCKKILNFTTNGNGQASTGLNPVVRNESIHSRNSSCRSTNDLNKSPSSELSSSVLQNQDSSNNNNVDSSTNNEDHNSTSGVDSEMHVERIDSKNDPHISPCDWDKPSCSGINSIECDVVDLSLETDLCFLKNMFPSVDEDVLKSYLEIYQDMEECVRVVSNLLYGGVDGVDDIYINEDLKPTASETTRDTKQTLNNCSDTIDTHEHKSTISNHSNLPIKKESVNDSPGEKRLKDHYGKSKTDLKSERKLDNHNSMENKVPLSSNSREVNTGSSRSLHTMRTPPSSSKKKPKPSSKETSLNDVVTTNGERESKSQTLDTKVCPTDSKFHTSNSLPSTNIVQVGIDIRFGKNKVHPSMKRCLDKSLASRDIAQPYRGNRDTKASQNSLKSSGEVIKDTLNCSSDPSPSKRVCKGNSTIATSTHNSSSISTFVDARSSDLRGSPLTSRDSSANTVAQSPSKRGQGQSSSQNSSSTITFVDARSSDSRSNALRGSPSTSRKSSVNAVAQSPSKRGQGQSSSQNSSSTITFTDARSSDSRGSLLTSRNSSVNKVTQSPSRRTFSHSLKPVSPDNSSRTNGFTSPSSSRNPSEDSNTNFTPAENITRSQPSTISGTDFSSFINSVSKRMLESQGSLVSNPTAEMLSKKGKGPSKKGKVSPDNSSRTYDFTISSTSRNPSEDSNTNFTPAENLTRSQPSTISATDFSSFINSVSKRMLESQGSLVSNQNAEMPSKKGKVSPDNNSRTYDFTISSSSRNPSEDSNTNFTPAENLTRSQPSTISGTDFISFINSVSKRMLESQGSLFSNQNAEMPSKKGKGPKLPTSSPSTYSFDANEGIHIDWGNIVRSMNDNQSSSATNTQPQIATPNKTITDQSTGIHQGKTANNGQTMFTTVVKQESQNQSTSPTNGTPNRLATAYLNPEQMVLVVRKDKSDSNECLGLPSESQNLAHSSQQEELSVEEEAARQEMLDLQRDTEMLTKVCPESDPNYIFSRLEELKDKPNRVAIVNKELIENASISGDVGNVIQKQKKVVWSWEDKKMRRILFSRAESNIIESKYTKHNGSLVEVKFSAVTLVLWFNFNSMTVQETLKNKIRHVYRTESMEEIVPGKDNKREETGLSLPPLSNPETWHGHGSSTSNTTTAMTRDLFEVLPGTSEFAHVDVLLKKSLPQAIIKKIKRVKNDWLERKYGIQRALLREKNGPGVINEMELFHGTRQTPPSVVWDSEEGFDMRYSADGMWGRGCYFAVNAAYSHHQFTHQYIHKRKRYYQIFLAHVLTGESINTDPDRSIRKPPLNVATGRHYDSITGITQGHRIYVLYKNEASFPAYLITYTM